MIMIISVMLLMMMMMMMMMMMHIYLYIGYDTNYDDKIAPAKPVTCLLPLREVQQSIELRTQFRR